MRPNRRLELSDLMQFNEFINAFRNIERLVWFKGVDGPERNGEHVFQLCLACWFVIQRCKLKLNLYRVFMAALVHDLVETYAKDTPAFGTHYPNGDPVPSHSDKMLRETEALKRIRREWGAKFPELVEVIDDYELKIDEECRFVYAMDKLMPVINICQDNGRSWHKLGVSMETHDLYKRPKVAQHPVVAELYEVLFEHMLKERDTLFPRTQEPVK